MIAEIICGKTLASAIYFKLAEELAKMHKTPGLAVIMVGDNPSSKIYVANKIKTCNKLGINSFRYEFANNISQDHLLEQIQKLNQDPKVSGILVQLPLPEHLNVREIVEAIDPKKDVDGFHPQNVGKLVLGLETMVPCTPLGCLHMIKSVCHDISGKHAVVVGRSNIVGRPMSQLLLNNNCTVTICHSHTKNLQEITSQADILVAAIGKSKIISAEHVKKGAIVIDVGINRDIDGKIVGDVDFASVKEVAGYITPVPGGVGPMTIAYLMHNTIKAAK